MHRTGESTSIHTQRFPSHDTAKLADDTVTVVIQVGGKLRDSLVIDLMKAQEKEVVEKLAREQEQVKKHIGTATIRKVVFVPGKLINFVV